MRLGSKSLEFIVNFLLGVSWALTLLGAISAFALSSDVSFFYMIVYTLIGMIPGIIALLVLEHVITSKEAFLELQKQTKLLETLSQERH